MILGRKPRTTAQERKRDYSRATCSENRRAHTTAEDAHWTKAQKSSHRRCRPWLLALRDEPAGSLQPKPENSERRPSSFQGFARGWKPMGLQEHGRHPRATAETSVISHYIACEAVEMCANESKLASLGGHPTSHPISFASNGKNFSEPPHARIHQLQSLQNPGSLLRKQHLTARHPEQLCGRQSGTLRQPAPSLAEMPAALATKIHRRRLRVQQRSRLICWKLHKNMAKMDPRFPHSTAWEPAQPERRSFAIRQLHHRKQPCKDESRFGRNACWRLLPLLPCSIARKAESGALWTTRTGQQAAAQR
jgi:hypothetical protein